MPLLQEFSRVNQESVAVIGINVMESNAVVKEYVQTNKISFTILLDSDGRVQEAYRILGLPTTYFVDENKNFTRGITLVPIGKCWMNIER